MSRRAIHALRMMILGSRIKEQTGQCGRVASIGKSCRVPLVIAPSSVWVEQVGVALRGAIDSNRTSAHLAFPANGGWLEGATGWAGEGERGGVSWYV